MSVTAAALVDQRRIHEGQMGSNSSRLTLWQRGHLRLFLAKSSLGRSARTAGGPSNFTPGAVTFMERAGRAMGWTEAKADASSGGAAAGASIFMGMRADDGMRPGGTLASATGISLAGACAASTGCGIGVGTNACGSDDGAGAGTALAGKA